ncbi:hypothetical protein C8R46DRAFT_1349458 [Mycena filopes]|nr:hypothetical protein C8R46DRAFT_1349458 [Mycena filopes]
MPILGSSHNDNKLQKRDPAAEAQGHGYATAQSTNIDDTMDHMGGITGVGSGSGSGAGVAGVGGGMNEYDGTRRSLPMQSAHQQQPQPGMGMGAGGAGMSGGMGAGMGGGDPAIPASEHLGTGVGGGGAQQHHAGGGAVTGKIEQKVGALVGSEALKAKGLQKEQEALAFKVQSQELAEAEGLEREAGLRRERAVAHGAHPDNRHVGGMGGAGGEY